MWIRIGAEVALFKSNCDFEEQLPPATRRMADRSNDYFAVAK